MFTKYTSDAQRFSSDECFRMHSVLILIEAQGLEVERLLSLNCFEEVFNNWSRQLHPKNYLNFSFKKILIIIQTSNCTKMCDLSID